MNDLILLNGLDINSLEFNVEDNEDEGISLENAAYPGRIRQNIASVLVAPSTVIVQNGVAGTLAFLRAIICVLRPCSLPWVSPAEAGRLLTRAGLRQLTCCTAIILSFAGGFCSPKLRVKIRRI